MMTGSERRRMSQIRTKESPSSRIGSRSNSGTFAPSSRRTWARRLRVHGTIQPGVFGFGPRHRGSFSAAVASRRPPFSLRSFSSGTHSSSSVPPSISAVQMRNVCTGSPATALLTVLAGLLISIAVSGSLATTMGVVKVQGVVVFACARGICVSWINFRRSSLLNFRRI